MSLGADTDTFNFYKGVSLPNGKPAIVNFLRHEGEWSGAREARRWKEEGKMAKYYTVSEYKNRNDDLFSWLSDLQKVMHLFPEGSKKPEIVNCTYSQAIAFTQDPATSFTREEIQGLRNQYNDDIAREQKRRPGM